MPWLRTSSIVLAGIFLSATAYADLVPPYGGGQRHPYVSSINLYVGAIPKGMVLLYLDQDGKLLEKARGNEVLIIQQSGTVYGAREKQLSQPFSFKTDQTKLFKLKTYLTADLPQSLGRPPDPAAMYCDMLSAKAGEYALKCQK
jgi:hypothetical protein